MSNLKNKRVITAALCGSWATKDMNPAVPYTPEEIARDAYECWKAGAAIVHIHVRNADGSPSTKFELYKMCIRDSACSRRYGGMIKYIKVYYPKFSEIASFFRKDSFSCPTVSQPQ